MTVREAGAPTLGSRRFASPPPHDARAGRTRPGTIVENMRTVVLSLLLLVAGCEAGPEARGPGPGPHLTSVDLLRTHADTAPLLWTVDLEADEPVTLEVRWTDGSHQVAVAFDEPARAHRHGSRSASAPATPTRCWSQSPRPTAAPARSPSARILAPDPPPWFPESELVGSGPRARPRATPS